MPIASDLAQWASRLAFDDLPADVVRATKLRVLDVIGLALAGAPTAFGRSVRDAAVALSTAGRARIFGTGDAVNVHAPESLRERASAFVELTKPRITTLVLLTTAAGFFLGARGSFSFALFASTIVGVALLCSGVSALNEWMERDLDALMRRTASRPLPTGRLTPRAAFCS